ncbi:hypothetical protein [Natrinema pallidum]|nr:hypothetical protein [Natrinema pallidum]
MKSGVIGVVSSDFSDIEPFEGTVSLEGFELTKCIEITDRVELPDGSTAISGRAAEEVITEGEDVQIRDGSIGTYSTREKDLNYTEFLALPGEIVIVKSSAGTFAFDLIGSQTGTVVERAKFDLESFVDHHQGDNFWQMGFYGTGGNADKGVVYGDNVQKDGEVGGVLESSKINQIGLEHLYETEPIKITVTESGYVNVYDPSNYESEEFLRYFKDELLSYVQRP